MSWFSWGKKETKYERISPKAVSSETDRVVFRVTSETGEVSFLKVFIPQKTTTTHLVDFRREYAIGSFANNLGSLTATSFGGGESLPEDILKKLSQQKDIVKDIYSKGKKGQVLRRFPFIYTKPIPGETLADYLQSRTTPLPKNVIRKVAFQIIYIMARLHSEYGIVHNDLYEYNLIVEKHSDYLARMQKEGKPGKNDFYYAVETDFFKLSFEAEDLHVTVFDFGGSAVQPEADVYYTPANKKDLSNTWRTAGELTLAVNNPPEYIFGESQNKTAASDAFMIGIVLATMAAHETWEQPDGATYAYTPYKSVHMYESGNEPKITSASRDVKGILGMVESNGMTSAGDGDPETTIRFGLRYRQFYNEIFAQSNVRDPFQLQTSGYFYGNYPTSADNMFDGLQRLYQNSGGPSFLGLIRNLLNADTTARLKFGIPDTLPFRYCLTSALFHPYFEPLYIGYGGSVGIVADYLTTTLAPPLPYNASRDKMALLEKAEADFNAKIASGNVFAAEEEEAQQDPQAAEALARAEREKEERLRQAAEEAERKKREDEALAKAAAAAAASAKAAADATAAAAAAAADAAAAKALEEANAQTEAQRLAAEQARQEAEAEAQAAAAAQAKAQAQAEAKAKAAADAAAQQEADRREAEELKRVADEEAARAALAQSESAPKDLSPEMQRLVELAREALKELPSASGRQGFYKNVQEALNLIYQVASKDRNVLAKLAAYGTVSLTGPKQRVEVPQGSAITGEQFAFYTKEGKLIPVEVKANFIMIIASIYMLLTGNDISNDETHRIKKVGDMVAAATQKFGPAFEVDGGQSNASPAPEKEKEDAPVVLSPAAPKKSKVNEPEIQKQGSGAVSITDTQVVMEAAIAASNDIIAMLLNGNAFDRTSQLENIGRKVIAMRVAYEACDDATKAILQAEFGKFNLFENGVLYGGIGYNDGSSIFSVGQEPTYLIPYFKSSKRWRLHLALYCGLASMAMMTKLVVYSLRNKKAVPVGLVKLISQGDNDAPGLGLIFTQASAYDYDKTNVISIPDNVVAQVRALDESLSSVLPLQGPIDFDQLNAQVAPLFAAAATKHWKTISQNEAAFELARILRFHPEMVRFTNDPAQVSETSTFIGTNIQEQQHYLNALGKLREFVEGNCNNISLASDALKSYRAFVKLSK